MVGSLVCTVTVIQVHFHKWIFLSRILTCVRGRMTRAAPVRNTARTPNRIFSDRLQPLDNLQSRTKTSLLPADNSCRFGIKLQSQLVSLCHHISRGLGHHHQSFCSRGTILSCQKNSSIYIDTLMCC